jgi:hypothetical protein
MSRAAFTAATFEVRRHRSFFQGALRVMGNRAGIAIADDGVTVISWIATAGESLVGNGRVQPRLSPGSEEISLTETLTIVSKDEMLRRIHSDYLEMPDLRLSPSQAQRVWQLDEQTCTELLKSLTEEGLLQRTTDGTYALNTETLALATAN